MPAEDDEGIASASWLQVGLKPNPNPHICINNPPATHQNKLFSHTGTSITVDISFHGYITL